MKICWDIEKDVPDLIWGVPGADSGDEIEKNKKYESKKFRKKFGGALAPPRERIPKNLEVEVPKNLEV